MTLCPCRFSFCRVAAATNCSARSVTGRTRFVDFGFGAAGSCPQPQARRLAAPIGALLPAAFALETCYPAFFAFEMRKSERWPLYPAANSLDPRTASLCKLALAAARVGFLAGAETGKRKR